MLKLDNETGVKRPIYMLLSHQKFDSSTHKPLHVGALMP